MVLLCLCSAVAQADSLPVAVFSFDNLAVGGGATFGLDLTNFSGPLGGSEVTTALSFADLSVVVTFASGATAGATLAAVDAFGDYSTGESFVSGDVVSAVLTGDFLPTVVSLADGSTVMIASAFSATITDSLGALQDGDFALINADTSPIVAGVSEPDAGVSVLLGLALAGVLVICRRSS
jgi:hypothetical protein